MAQQAPTNFRCCCGSALASNNATFIRDRREWALPRKPDYRTLCPLSMKFATVRVVRGKQ